MVGKLNQLPNQASQLYETTCALLDDMGKAEKWKIDMKTWYLVQWLHITENKLAACALTS